MLNDFILEQVKTIQERCPFSCTDIAEQFKHAMSQNGFEFLGNGAYALAFVHPKDPDKVIKIGPISDAWLYYATYCMRHAGNKWLPVIHEVYVPGGGMYYASMERLSYVNDFPAYSDIRQNIPHFFQTFGWLHLDLGPDHNIMQRKDGQCVYTDPLSCEPEGGGAYHYYQYSRSGTIQVGQVNAVVSSSQNASVRTEQEVPALRDGPYHVADAQRQGIHDALLPVQGERVRTARNADDSGDRYRQSAFGRAVKEFKGFAARRFPVGVVVGRWEYEGKCPEMVQRGRDKREELKAVQPRVFRYIKPRHNPPILKPDRYGFMWFDHEKPERRKA